MKARLTFPPHLVSLSPGVRVELPGLRAPIAPLESGLLGPVRLVVGKGIALPRM